MPDLVTGSIRTVFTLAIGAVLTAGADWVRRETGIELPTDPTSVQITAGAVFAFVTSLWYLVFASLERRWPLFGIFLGWPRAPRYDIEGEVTRREEAQEPPQELPAPRLDDGASRTTRGADPLP